MTFALSPLQGLGRGGEGFRGQAPLGSVLTGSRAQSGAALLGSSSADLPPQWPVHVLGATYLGCFGQKKQKRDGRKCELSGS